ncbi:MAG: hypothetical protein C0631_00910 [Sedimenticola sp.]|nr:MAG: hypothetical protein C0631_00910 [Sedimenticola sp.]
MKYRGSDILVGVFVLALSGVLIAGVLWFSSSRPGRSYDEYLVYMQESVSGLSRDSAVKFYGVDVGRVHEIRLGKGHPKQVRLLLQLDKDTPVSQDTIATLETQGLTGLSYINLRGGLAGKPPIVAAAGEDYPVIRSEPTIWGRLDQSLAELSDNLIRASAKLDMLLSEENLALVTQNLNQLLSMLSQLSNHNDAITRSIEDLGATLHNTRQASENLPGLTNKLSTTADSLNRMAKEISQTAVSMRETVSSGGDDIRELTLKTMPGLQSMIEELRRAAENFRQFSEQLERNPQILLYGQSPARPGPGE